jgi:hypothetical protein
MKTTVELPDALLNRARRLAAREGTTIRALVEESLRRVLAERERGQRFELKPVTFKGEGLSPEASRGGWDEIRDRIYDGRGT